MTNDAEPNGQGALSHLRIIEYGDIPASYAARWLGDLGADIVKVEPPAATPTAISRPLPATSRTLSAASPSSTPTSTNAPSSWTSPTPMPTAKHSPTCSQARTPSSRLPRPARSNPSA